MAGLPLRHTRSLEGLIYMCACPAQVAEAMRMLRAVLQDCLDHVLKREQWDRATLQMPPHLRKRQMKEMLAED